DQPFMKEVSTTGIDIAKRVYQAHGNQQGRRGYHSPEASAQQGDEFSQRLPACLIGPEAFASEHH
ncbi:MAG: IS110 family transposase, partial [Cypionkella sp.]